MKKTVAIVLVIALALAAVLALTACNKNESDELTYKIEESTANVGDTHGTPTIKATLPDKTVKDVTNNLVYDQDDIEKLKLDKDNKYTKDSVGVHTVKVYILEEKEKFFLGEWKITVKVTK